ncbi:MAG: adenosylcobinamide amidohydrolase [Methanobacteriaceae archaeon]|jgi:adenosylcobinamide amidohydrolase|nr:adenosylcobinamide amidohydrolase [Methanobacteriaceae archaeon]
MSFFTIEKNKNSLVVKFSNRAKGITNSFLNGGFMENLQAIFNYTLSQDDLDNLENKDLYHFLKEKSIELGLDYQKTQALVTKANMYNASLSVKTYKKTKVATISTGGVRVNASCAGDPNSYFEENGKFKAGTINLIILIDGNLNETTLLEGILTATEAKSAVFSDLLISSNFSNKIATGTGTDGISIISNSESPEKFTNASKHSKLGELIGLSVIEAIKKTLKNEMNLSPKSQSNALVRISRIEKESKKFYESTRYNKFEIVKSLKENMYDSCVIAITSLVINLIDQSTVDLINKEIAYKIAIFNINNYLKEEKYFSYKLLLRFICEKNLNHV